MKLEKQTLMHDALAGCCYTCQFWDPMVDREPYSEGSCLRHAPSPQLAEVPIKAMTHGAFVDEKDKVLLVRWPLTAGRMRCGEYQQSRGLLEWLEEIKD